MCLEDFWILLCFKMQGEFLYIFNEDINAMLHEKHYLTIIFYFIFALKY